MLCNNLLGSVLLLGHLSCVLASQTSLRSLSWSSQLLPPTFHIFNNTWTKWWRSCEQKCMISFLHNVLFSGCCLPQHTVHVLIWRKAISEHGSSLPFLNLCSQSHSFNDFLRFCLVDNLPNKECHTLLQLMLGQPCTVDKYWFCESENKILMKFSAWPFEFLSEKSYPVRKS